MMRKLVILLFFIFLTLITIRIWPKPAVAQASCTAAQANQQRCINGRINICRRVSGQYLWTATSIPCNTGGTTTPGENHPTTALTPTTGADVPTPTSTTPGQGKIVFARMYGSDGKSSEIVVMNADGTNMQRLTNNNYLDQQATFSPDGSKIVFASKREDQSLEIYLMNADGSNQTKLTNNSVLDEKPAFSPDGSKIVYHSWRDGNPQIFSMNTDGSNQTLLAGSTSVIDWGKSPVFSPDGQKIAFVSGGEIFIMNNDGTNQVNLTNSSNTEAQPSFSPDGQTIIYLRRVFNTVYYHIYKMNLDGSNLVKLVSGSSTVGLLSPSYSPDGTKIIYTQRTRTGKDTVTTGIKIANANGTSSQTVTNGADSLGSAYVWIDPESPVEITSTPTPTSEPNQPTATPSPPAASQYLFEDDFSTDKNWAMVPETGATAGRTNGEYFVRHTVHDRNVRSLSPFDLANYSRFAVEIEGRIVQGANVSYGFVFNQLANNQYYRFMITPSAATGNNWQIQKFASSWQVLAEGRSTQISISTSGYKLRLERDGSSIKAYVYVQGSPQLLGQATDNTYLGGKAGVIAINRTSNDQAMEARFDNFTIADLAAAEVTGTPTPTPTTAPVITAPPNCPAKTQGDANCDGQINVADLAIWLCQVAGGTNCGQLDRAADFDLEAGVTLNDFEIWRQTNYNADATPSPTSFNPSVTPIAAQFYQFDPAASQSGKTIQQVCQTRGSQWNCTPSCDLLPVTGEDLAYYQMTQNPDSTTWDNDCYSVVPTNVTYLNACCFNQPMVPPTISPTTSAITPTPTNTPTLAPTNTPVPTDKPVPTGTACRNRNQTCSATNRCCNGLYCFQGICRNPQDF